GFSRDWSSDVCSSDLLASGLLVPALAQLLHLLRGQLFVGLQHEARAGFVEVEGDLLAHRRTRQLPLQRHLENGADAPQRMARRPDRKGVVEGKRAGAG